ncbi:ribosomal subunit interface protein [Desulfuromonas versatilis]|uniref:RNA 3'-terminal phosphate cyclase n=1 Tax=Desulfuromonas versatilis TaxID=2802975 RepID=A0ABN6E672_9BACT|nr:RNA 3'-terminal phosphate cyclase [Desulfuromonas versatilis]BCR06754.1 ribosomal subunit interface protein [Desulfuromonas versatilis]
MVEIDGSYGEGGGQVLRSALSLSLLTGRAVRLKNIRSGRSRPGLMPQHLKAVQAASAVGRARVEGAAPGSTALVFEPAGLHPGQFRFDIGTAGSTSLVLQTILLPLCLAGEPSHCVITGGTHVPWSPCYHYLQRLWLPCLRRAGLEVALEMERTGFYPRGGGKISASIAPVEALRPLSLAERGAIRSASLLSFVTQLDERIAERQLHQARRRLAGRFGRIEQELAELPGPGKGSLLLVVAEFEHSRCCYYGLGERGKSAERVADEAVDALERFLGSGGAIDEHLADQLLLPLALAEGRSELRTARVTEHLLTNAWVIRQFLPADIVIEEAPGRAGLVRIDGCGWPPRKL